MLKAILMLSPFSFSSIYSPTLFISLLFIFRFFMSEDQVDVAHVDQGVGGKG